MSNINLLLSTAIENVEYRNTIIALFFILVICIIIFLIFGFPLLVFIKNSYKRNKVLPHGEIKYKYAILIPARNESDVISNSLDSLLRQDYDPDYFDVYVIVESEKDPTVKITKSKGYNIVVRTELENRRTKGFALDDGIQHIKHIGKKYDAYVVFDADNILEPSYLSKLNDIKNLGYDLGVGDRLFTNAEESWVAACSATLFSYMSKVTCKARTRFFEKVTIMGTGFYINSNIIDDAGGWIWNNLSEDSQLTNYCYYHNIRCYYYPLARYYDEQPSKYTVLHKQHTRWVWGYVTAGFKKTNDLIYNKHNTRRFKLAKMEVSTSLFPFLFINIALVFNLVCSLLLMLSAFFQVGFTSDSYIQIINFKGSTWFVCTIYFLLSLFFTWFPWLFIPLVIFAIDKQNIAWSSKTKIKVCLTYGLFFYDFALAFLDGLIFPKKRKAWKQIKHSGNITCSQAFESITQEINKKDILDHEKKKDSK